MSLAKKIFSGALALAMSSLLLVGCGGNANSNSNSNTDSDTDTAKIKTLKEGTLSIGMEIAYPPFEIYANDGVTPTGYDVDLSKAIGDKLGLKVEFVNTAFDSILNGIGTNYDIVISAITITDKRKESVLFSDSYIDNYQAVVVKKGSDIKINSLNDLNGKTVALQKKSASDVLLEDLTGKGTIKCTKVGQEHVTTCFTQLKNGDVDVLLADSTVADGYVAKNPNDYEIVFLDKTTPEQFGIAFAKTDKEGQKVVNDALKELEKEGFLDDNYNKWFGSSAE